MNTTKLVFVMSLLVIGASMANTALAVDVDDALVIKWQDERDDTVVSLITGWLRGAKAGERVVLVQELVRLEALIATCSLESVPNLYMTGITDPENLETVPAQLLSTYLEQNGLSVESSAFFADKTFTLLEQHRVAGSATRSQLVTFIPR